MSEGVNKVILLGNLGADGELLNGSTPVLKLRVATTERYTDKTTNEKQEKTEWHRVTLFGKRAEALAPYLKKGQQVFIEGRLQTSSYEKNGEKRYSTDIIATNIVFAGGNGNGANHKNDNTNNKAGTPAEGYIPDQPDVEIPF